MNRAAALLAVSLISIGAASPAPPSPPSCGMTVALAHPDRDGQTTTAIWRGPDSRALLFGDALNINTDGTKRSYKVTDFWGETDALNNLCNAMAGHCAGLDRNAMRARRIATEQARAAGWPAAALAATRISPGVIAMTRHDGRMVPCPEVDGFLVSATALQDPGISDPCKVERYVDALTVSAVVIPGSAAFRATGARIGDLAVVQRPGQAPIYAVVGDSGPAKQIGEVSIALAGRLLGKTTTPVNYMQLRGRGQYRGQGWTVPMSHVLIFPGTANAASPYLTQDRIDQDAAAIFNHWGAGDRLAACAAAYRQR